ncbi:MAG: PadR family transcriptional regulator [Candidatus Omnitrophica bacterium]|nr:PadR family transcriptional regulator [Candidatus Omnitrophota bacterium]
MIQRFIILGILKKHPATGYDIKKFITKELGLFSQLETRSIYYPLQKMEKEGFVERKEVPQARLRKYTYCITSRGEREFSRLAKEALLSERRPFIEIDIPLYFLSFLNKEEVLPLLRLRMRFLREAENWLLTKRQELKSSPRNIQLLIGHHLGLVATERTFLKEMFDTVKQQKFDPPPEKA